MKELLDFEAAKAGERYVAFLLTLRGLYETSLLRTAIDVSAIQSISLEGAAIADQFIEREVARLDEALDLAKGAGVAAIRQTIYGSSGAPMNEGDDYSDELLTWFRRELAVQAYRDVNTLAQARRAHALQAAFSNRAIRTFKGGRGIDFLFTDRSGRKYPAQKFYRNLFRQTLLVFAVECAASDAASFGYEQVFIEHQDKNKSYTGVPITLTDNPNMLSLHEVRDEVFHPNSTAFLTTQQP